MYDLDHLWGDDLTASSTGDLLPVTGTEMGQQRILRRLLTNSNQTLPDGTVTVADCIFHPEYGAGLGKYIGQPDALDKIRANIRRQILLEAIVAKTPEPQISVTEIPNGVTCAIHYTDAKAKLPVVLSFNINQ